MLRNLFFLLLFIVFCIVQTRSQREQEIELDASIQAEYNKIADLKEGTEKEDLFQNLLKNAFAKGHAKGRADGHDSAESKSFLSSFECAASSSKALLERAYKKGQHLCTSDFKSEYETLQFPTDILKLIRENEPWIMKFELEMEKLKHETPGNPQLKFPCTSASLVPKESKPLEPLEKRIKYSFITWYAIMISEPYDAFLPLYVKELQVKLISFKNMNADTYKGESIYLRFAAHMAFCYKMMCAMQHAASNSLRSYAEKHPEVDFTELLFSSIPEYHITLEQVIFLNFLRECLPYGLLPILHVYMNNPRGECRLVPYVGWENCGRLSKKKLIDPKNVPSLATPPHITVIHQKGGIH